MSAPTCTGWWLRVVPALGGHGVHEYAESVFEVGTRLWFSCDSCVPRVQPVEDHTWVGRMVLESIMEPGEQAQRMDAERLADLRNVLADALKRCDPAFGYPLQSYARDLLVDRDRLAAEVERLKAEADKAYDDGVREGSWDVPYGGITGGATDS